MDQRNAILMLRIAAVVVFVTALAVFVGELRTISSFVSVAFLQPFALFIISGGVVALLLGVAALLEPRQKPVSGAAIDAAMQNQLIELSIKLDDLAASVNRQGRERDAAPLASPLNQQDSGAPPEVLIALQRLFEELRDLSLLPDEQRRQRWQEMKEQRRENAIKNATTLIHTRQWAAAQTAITEIEADWPDNAASATLRADLDARQSQAAAEALGLVESQIESEMSLSHWDQAYQLAHRLAADFPASAQAAKLLNRVEREKAIYTETTVQRLYEEIRRDVERRIWRQALGHAQKLLEKFPDHVRAESVRKQIKTIQDNAEIEERQEQEMRIGELIRSRRFSEAVQLSQELLRRFPMSPQAEAIEKLLPRIQQLAAEQESKSPA